MSSENITFIEEYLPLKITKDKVGLFIGPKGNHLKKSVIFKSKKDIIDNNDAYNDINSHKGVSVDFELLKVSLKRTINIGFKLNYSYLNIDDGQRENKLDFYSLAFQLYW